MEVCSRALFFILAREFESVETCPGFAQRVSTLRIRFMILEKKLSSDESLELSVVFSRKKAQVTRKRSSILLKKTKSEQKTCKHTLSAVDLS